MTRRVSWLSIPAIAIAGLASVMIGGSWQMARLAREHGQLAEQLAPLQAQAASDAREDQAAVVTQIARLNAEIEKETARLADAQAQTAAAKEALPPMNGQVLRSLGRIEDLGRQAGRFIEQVVEFSKAASGPSAPTPNDGEMMRAMQSMMSWTGRRSAGDRATARDHDRGTLETRCRDNGIRREGNCPGICRTRSRRSGSLEAAFRRRTRLLARTSGRRSARRSGARRESDPRGSAPAMGRRAVVATRQRILPRHNNGR
jgi:hypothetical protein